MDKICVTEQDVNILASDRNYELNIEIFIDNIIHFQITDESYKVKFSEYLFENKEKNDWDRNPAINYFFEIIDDSYMDWLKEESFDFLKRNIIRLIFSFLAIL